MHARPSPELQPDAERTLALQTFAELLTATDRLSLSDPYDGAAEVVETLYALRDILGTLSVTTTTFDRYLTAAGQPCINVTPHPGARQMVGSPAELLRVVNILAGATASTLSQELESDAHDHERRVHDN